MLSRPETRVIQAAVYGGPGTGKKTLISSLNRVTFRRPRDGLDFSFDAVLGDESTRAMVAIVTVDVSATHLLKRGLVESASKSAALTCIALTKADVVPRDCDNSHRQMLIDSARLSFVTNLDVIMVNSTSADELVEYLVRAVAPAQKPYTFDLTIAYRRIQSILLDWVAACFCLSSAAESPTPAADLAKITSNEDVQTLAQSSMATTWSKNLHRRVGNDENLPPVAVYLITQSLVAKRLLISERASMEFVRQHTSIPVPRVYHPHLDWLIMDHIDGEMLYECWHKQSTLMQFRIACTLRLYLKQMRSIERASVGTLGSGRVFGIIFQDYEFGPFDTPRRFKHFCQYVSSVGWDMQTRFCRARGQQTPPVPRLPADWTPVLTHGDLNTSNILLDKRGTLWLVDWGFAGFYPQWMDSLVMRHFNEDVFRDDVSPSWVRYRHFIAGNTSADDGWFWDYFYAAIHRFQGGCMYW